MSAVRAARLAALLLLLLLMSLWPAATATAAESVSLQAALVPERLGAGTTIEFSFQIATPNDSLPPPLLALNLSYPANIGIVTSGLGIATCEIATLEAVGPRGCPADSLMGHGTVLVEIPIGPEIIAETGHITTWMAPIENGHLSLLFYGDGETPVSAEVLFTSILLEAPAPYGGQLDTEIPEIPGLPGGSNPTVVQMRATIGPKDITYYRRSHGKTIAYKPAGLVLPLHCPHGGFPFAGTFIFLGGPSKVARTTVPCPGQDPGVHAEGRRAKAHLARQP